MHSMYVCVCVGRIYNTDVGYIHKYIHVHNYTSTYMVLAWRYWQARLLQTLRYWPQLRWQCPQIFAVSERLWSCPLPTAWTWWPSVTCSLLPRIPHWPPYRSASDRYPHTLLVPEHQEQNRHRLLYTVLAPSMRKVARSATTCHRMLNVVLSIVLKSQISTGVLIT